MVRPLEGWRVASKGLRPLPRRRGSALAHGCRRGGRGALPLARAAVVSTGLRIRPATRRLVLLHEACAVGPLCELAGGRVAAAVGLLAEYEAHAPRPQRTERVLQRAPGLGLRLGLGLGLA